MASSKDVREMLGLPKGDGGSKPPAAKKAKPAAAHPRLKGINREILALHGDRAPPVSIIESGKSYRAKLQRGFKPAHWENVAFTNQARTDGLQLRHWRKQKGPQPANEEDAENQDPQKQPEEYEFAKYNIQPTVPTYTDEQYEKHLKSDSWSRQETDYLMDLVRDYAYRWAVIIDRYEWTENKPKVEEDSTTALARASDHQPRTLEQLKQRYYQVWAKSIELSAGGEKNMSESEFALHETLTKYNPCQEENRKNLAWKLAERNADDVREEEMLLSELQRIMVSSQKLEAERQEVRDRLEPAAPINGGTNMYTSANSAALQQLHAHLAAQDRNRKARHRLSLNVNDMGSSPAGMAGLANGTPATAASHRESVSGSGQKKGSVAAPMQTPVRQLSPRQEARYGITTHERLTSGVTFRSDKLLKMRQAKSQIQTQKIANALVELQVPELLVLPTDRVCNTFEALVQRVAKLVESRKLLDKEENELKVAINIKEEKLRQEGKQAEQAEPPKEPEADADGDVSMQDAPAEDPSTDKAEPETNGESEADVPGEPNADADIDADADAEADADGDEDADGEDAADGEADEEEVQAEVAKVAADEAENAGPPPSSATRAGHKRSASVLSVASSKASKRGRK